MSKQLDYRYDPNEKYDSVLLETYPDKAENWIRVFSVPFDWFVNIMDNLSMLTNDTPFDLQFFLDNYCFDETYLVYQIAKRERVMLSDEIVKR